MISRPTQCILYLASLVGSTQAWGDSKAKDESPFKESDQGQIAFVSSSGELDSDSSLVYDKDTKTIKVETFAANSYGGDSLNFRGREIRNAHVVDSSVEGLKHLTVESLALRSSSSERNGNGLATIDDDGEVKKSTGLRWDDKDNELKLPALSSFSKSGLEIRSDVDFTSHQLKNFYVEPNTALSELIFKDGYIENSVLHNVTATGLNLGDVVLDSISISRFDSRHEVGSMLVVGEDGAVEASPTLKLDDDGTLLIDSKVTVTKPMDLNDKEVLNANIKSGSIDGNIDVSVDFIKAEGITLKNIQEDKTVTSNGLAVLDLDGKLNMGPISIDKSGSLGDFRVHGTIDFASDQPSSDGKSVSRGNVVGANIIQGTIEALEKLSVAGETELGSGLQVLGETYLDGSLTVSGSVLGSGPYVDVSDRRYKKNIASMNSSEVLEKILKLDGVSYELDMTRLKRRLGGGNADSEDIQGRQFGFIAQEVEKIFPELVSSDEDEFKGLQYARFAPILVESLKQLTAEVRSLREENEDMKRTTNSLEQRLGMLERIL